MTREYDAALASAAAIAMEIRVQNGFKIHQDSMARRRKDDGAEKESQEAADWVDSPLIDNLKDINDQ